VRRTYLLRQPSTDEITANFVYEITGALNVLDGTLCWLPMARV